MRGLLLTLAMAPLLGACSLLSWSPFAANAPPAPTLADLQPAALPQAGAGMPRVRPAELEDIYRQVLAITEDPATRLVVLHRLADIEMLQAEEYLAEAPTPATGSPATPNPEPGALFTAAVAAYRSLLLENPDNPAADRWLYQLSRAHELNGENDKSLAALELLTLDHPQSAHYPEARFRLAENYFSEGGYAAAEQAYAEVAELQDTGPYYRNALYMHGWSQFKQGRYRPSIASFTRTLDLLVPADGNLATLERGALEIAEDCLRVLSVVFSYLEGADTIAAAYEQLGHRPYEHLLYQHLGGLYLRQERYRDSAETYRAFNRAWPMSAHAHDFQLRVIETYEAGGFGELILAEKKHYVEAYGVQGAYWAASANPVREQITPRLKLYIEELATHHHARAQSPRQQAAQARREFMLAGDYYQLYVDSFSEDERVPDMLFLLGESRWEAGEAAQAIAAYERVAYDYPGNRHAADAGYAAIIAWDGLPDQAGADAEKLARAKTESQLRYAGHFPQDDRAAPVLGNAAAALLEMTEYELAIIAAATLLRRQPATDSALRIPAWLTIAHSYFEIPDYPEAEQAYQLAAAAMASADPRREPAVERLAASIYRQGEDAARGANYSLAAQQFERVIERAPQSTVRLQAQYDAAANHMEAAEFARANELLRDFRERFAGHPLGANIPTLLVANYLELEQWQAAARELDAMQAREDAPERRRQFLYLAAEYYDRAGDSAQALTRYRSYAHNWPQPVAERFEAMSRLAELYAASDQADKRNFWLRKIIATHTAEAPGLQAKTAEPAEASRVRYLAAFASSELAGQAYADFRAIAIGQPLARSLKKKKAAMQHVLEAYRNTSDYGVAEFTTLATYRMAEIYRELSAELLDSPRPDNMDALALEQYDILLEEQAFPFEEKAIAIHETNARRSWQGLYDAWVKRSFTALAELMPVRYAKPELLPPTQCRPDLPSPCLNLAILYHLQGGTKRAGQVYLQAQQPRPQDMAAHNQYAIFLREQGRFGDAEQAYLDALAIGEDYPQTHRNLGILYDLYLGDHLQALNHFNRYRELGGADDRLVAGWIADLQRQALRLADGGQAP